MILDDEESLTNYCQFCFQNLNENYKNMNILHARINLIWREIELQDFHIFPYFEYIQQYELFVHEHNQLFEDSVFFQEQMGKNHLNESFTIKCMKYIHSINVFIESIGRFMIHQNQQIDKMLRFTLTYSNPEKLSFVHDEL